MPPEIASLIGEYGTAGAAGALAVVLLAALLGLATGRFLIRFQHDQIVAGHKLRGDEWKAAHEKSEAARSKAESQLSELLEESKLTRHILEEVLPPAPKPGDNGLVEADR